MTATVRVYYHEGIETAPVAAGTRYATDSVGALKQPYMAASVVTVSTGSATSCAAAPAKARIAYVQVQADKQVYFECNPPNRTVSASTDSPLLIGDQTFVIGPEWSFSFMETA